MLFILTPVLIRCLWQLKTVVFLHWCLIHVLFATRSIKDNKDKWHGIITLYHYPDCYYAECHVLFGVMLSVMFYLLLCWVSFKWVSLCWMLWHPLFFSVGFLVTAISCWITCCTKSTFKMKESSGLYHKHITIINDTVSIISK